MKTIFPLILTLSLILSSSKTPTDFKVIDIVNLQKVPIVKGSLNGKMAYFVLDTGAEFTVLHSDDASGYGFRTAGIFNDQVITGIGGNGAKVQKAFKANFKLEDVQMETAMYVTDISDIKQLAQKITGLRVTGIIGIDLIVKYAFEIDYGRKKLKFKTMR